MAAPRPPPQAANLGAPLPDGIVPDRGALPDGVAPETSSVLPDGVLPDDGGIEGVQNVVSPSGEIVGMGAEHLAAALKQGYRLPTPADLAKQERHEKYGSVGQGLATSAEAAASALSFGLSAGAERALGVPAEDIRGRAEENPVWHAAGTAAGIIAPLALTAGAAGPALAAGAEFTAPAAIARLGRAAAGAAGEAGGRMAGILAGGAAEGALYAGSDLTEKVLLHDPELTWEKAATELGLGTLFGGALAGGTDVAARGLGKLLTKATEGLDSIAARVASGDSDVVKLMLDAKHEIHALDQVVPGAAESISASTPETAKFILRNAERIKKLEGEFPGLTDILSRADPETGKDILANWSKLLKDPQARIDIGNSLTEAVNTSYSKIEGALREVNTDVRPAEIERLTANADPDKTRIAYGKLVDKVDGLAKTMRSEPDLYQPSAARELELISQGMKRDYFGEIAGDARLATLVDHDVVASAPPSMLFNVLNRTKQLVDAQAKFGKLVAPEWRRTASALKDLRTQFKLVLESPFIWGEAGARQAAFNHAQNLYFTARRAITDGPAYQKLMQKVVRPSGAVDFEANPRSINSWINLMADGRGGAKSDSFGAYLKASRDMADQMEQSGYPGAAGVRTLVDETAARAQEIRQRGTVTQLVKMLQGHEILSSGPAIPMGGRMALEAAKRLPGGVGHIVGGITGTIQKVRQPSVMVGVLSTLDKLAKKAATKLNAGADAIFRSGVSGAAAGEAATGTGTERFSHGGMVTPERFADVSSSLRSYGGDLDRLAAQVSKETGRLQEHAPHTAGAAHAFAARVVQHLGQKLPVTDQPTQFLDEPFEPSHSELAEYNRHHEVAARGPVAVLEHIARGTLLPEHLEASQAIYPRLHAELQHMVAEKLAAHVAAKKHVPIHLREALGMFLGSPLDHSGTPEAVLSAQSAFDTPAPPPPAQGRPRNVQTKVPQRIATASQGNEMRMGEKA